MIKYRTIQSAAEEPVKAPRECSVIRPKFQLSVDNAGKKCVVVAGQTNFHEMTQQALSDVLVANIVERFTRSGRVEELADNLGNMSDLTDVPSDLLGAQVQMLKAKQHFDKLPVDIRKHYNYSYTAYIADLDNRIKGYVAEAKKVKAEKEKAQSEVTENA